MAAVLTVHVPATSANLGPGFDCLALALDLWNRASFSLEGEGLRAQVSGEGQGKLPEDARNLILQAALRFYQEQGAPAPAALRVECDNRIPLGSGLGSSAAAVLSGLLGANALLGGPAGTDEILRLACELEGHADNAAAALLGGLALVTGGEEGLLAHGYPPARLQVAVAVPEIDLPTRAARAALPTQVPLADAIFNLGRAPFVIEALRSGELALLGAAMQDRLHQPQRLKLIPGAPAAIAAARQAGAAGVALSGAGPSVIAFSQGDPQAIVEAMQAAFEAAGLPTRGLILATSPQGAWVERSAP